MASNKHGNKSRSDISNSRVNSDGSTHNSLDYDIKSNSILPSRPVLGKEIGDIITIEYRFGLWANHGVAEGMLMSDTVLLTDDGEIYKKYTRGWMTLSEYQTHKMLERMSEELEKNPSILKDFRKK